MAKPVVPDSRGRSSALVRFRADNTSIRIPPRKNDLGAFESIPRIQILVVSKILAGEFVPLRQRYREISEGIDDRVVNEDSTEVIGDISIELV